MPTGQRRGDDDVVGVVRVDGEEVAVGDKVGFEGLNLEVEYFRNGSVPSNVGVEIMACALLDQGVVVFIVVDITGDSDNIFEGGEGDIFLFLFLTIDFFEFFLDEFLSHIRYCRDYSFGN